MKMCVSGVAFLVTLHLFNSTVGMVCDGPHPRCWAETPLKSKRALSVNSAVWVLRQQTEFRGSPHIHVFVAGTRQVQKCGCALPWVEGWATTPQQQKASPALEDTAEHSIQELWSMDEETDGPSPQNSPSCHPMPLPHVLTERTLRSYELIDH